MISEDAFLEHAEVFGNYYGTSREAIEVLATGVDVSRYRLAGRTTKSPECRTRGYLYFTAV